VCTPPKCGTTWTQTIVGNLLFPDGDTAKPLLELAPWLEARFTPLAEVLEELESQTGRRSIKSHTPADGIAWDPACFYIVVGRDGRDAFMSLVNHMASMRPDKVAELIESAVADGIELGPPPSDDIHQFFAQWLEGGEMFHFMSTYWQHRNEPNVLFVHYDELKQDLEKQIRRIAAFIGVGIDEKKMPGILQRCSFEWMRDNSDRIAPFEELFDGGGKSFFFKGVNGRWRDVLTAEEVASYEQRSREMLAPDLKAWLDRNAS